ncbi:unnamed protein product [Rhodiola kirilowii]
MDDLHVVPSRVSLRQFISVELDFPHGVQFANFATDLVSLHLNSLKETTIIRWHAD